MIRSESKAIARVGCVFYGQPVDEVEDAMRGDNYKIRIRIITLEGATQDTRPFDLATTT